MASRVSLQDDVPRWIPAGRDGPTHVPRAPRRPRASTARSTCHLPWAVRTRLRKDLIDGRITRPTYVSVDTATGTTLVEHVLSGDWLPGYRAFLDKSLQKTGRPLPAAK